MKPPVQNKLLGSTTAPRKWLFLHGRTDARNAAASTLSGNGGGAGRRAARPAPLPPLHRHYTASAFPAAAFFQPNTKYEAGGRMAVSSTFAVSRPTSSYLPSWPVLCFGRLLGPNSSHFEENILQRKFKSFCRRPVNHRVSSK